MRVFLIKMCLQLVLSWGGVTPKIGFYLTSFAAALIPVRMAM